MSVDCFFLIQILIVLVLGMMGDFFFLLYPGYLGYNVARLWIPFDLFCQEVTCLGVVHRSKWEWKFTFLLGPFDTVCVGVGALVGGWQRANCLYLLAAESSAVPVQPSRGH